MTPVLGTELLLTRPQTPQADWYTEPPKLKTDSSVLMVCTVPPADPENPTADLGNATTCQCQSWHTLTLPSATDTTKQNTVTYLLRA